MQGTANVYRVLRGLCRFSLVMGNPAISTDYYYFGVFSRTVFIYVVEVLVKYKVSMGLRLFFLTNFPGATFSRGYVYSGL